ncbi:MAG: anhydro-N-acetylmuramic acid kinase [Chitinophagales bacterium]
MLYSAIGLMSGSSMDGLDIVFVHLDSNAGKWNYEIRQKACYPYSNEWKEKLRSAIHLPAPDYLALHAAFGHYLGKEVNRFIQEYQLQYQVQLISSHGHTVFHNPSQKMTAQLGDGAAIAAETGINTISDLRAMDIALGGQGAPIVPIGEKLLLEEYPFFLNLGGIANISAHIQRPGNADKTSPDQDEFIAFDICPANRILNMLAAEKAKEFDNGGEMAAAGKTNQDLLTQLNGFEYYKKAFPKSLDNAFGVSELFPIIAASNDSIENKLNTYAEHICYQIGYSINKLLRNMPAGVNAKKILVCGGGAHNAFLVSRLTAVLDAMEVKVVVPEPTLVDFKEALIMAFIGVLRWREENNVLASVTGAKRNSIGGAVWIGQEA